MLDMGAVTVIAHPGATVKRTRRRSAIWPAAGRRDGGVFQLSHGEQRRHYEDLARRLGLTATAGSDFHGRSKPGLMPGIRAVNRQRRTGRAGARGGRGHFGHGGRR